MISSHILAGNEKDMLLKKQKFMSMKGKKQTTCAYSELALKWSALSFIAFRIISSFNSISSSLSFTWSDGSFPASAGDPRGFSSRIELSFPLSSNNFSDFTGVSSFRAWSASTDNFSEDLEILSSSGP